MSLDAGRRVGDDVAAVHVGIDGCLREMVEAAGEAVPRDDGGAVLRGCREGGAFGHASGHAGVLLVRAGADFERDGAKAGAVGSTGAVAARAGVGAMRVRIARREGGVIDATTERVAGTIRERAFG